MAQLFSPTNEDARRYSELRSLSRSLNSKITKTIPRQAMEEIGDLLGIRRNGVLVFDDEDQTSVLMDSCFYDWYEEGTNVVGRYADTHPATPGSDEAFLLQAYREAKYRILSLDSAVPGAGVHCQDVASGEYLFLMDFGLSRSLGGGKGALATRTLPIGEYWITTGAGLPFHSGVEIRAAAQRIVRTAPKPLEEQALTALTIVRACLAARTASQVVYADAPPPRKVLREPRWPGSKRRRRPQ